MLLFCFVSTIVSQNFFTQMRALSKEVFYSRQLKMAERWYRYGSMREAQSS